MSKYKEKEEVAKEVEITRADLDKLRDNLKPFPQKKINDRLTSSFEQYLQSIGVISFKEDGSFVVNAPEGYTRMNRINAKLELIEYYKDKEFLEQNPEAKEEHLKKISGMRASLANKFKV